MNLSIDALALIKWYKGVRRDLPWRVSRDPYRIWVSEVMLQQTTVAAVISYYESFMTRFPKLKTLAAAPIEDVLEQWAGLGYYSRARNLHRAAKILALKKFPRTSTELLELPGFGPYTARAVASLAFDEKTGVLDGNVIRILSRRFGVACEWWKPQGRAELQKIADQLAQVDEPADLNQGMMELGATVCTHQSPACLLCPWAKSCVARKTQRIAELPLRRPRREREIWHWSPILVRKRDRVLLIENTYAPFLKRHWILPGQAKRVSAKPKNFDYKGTVTHHDIFVTIQQGKTENVGKSKWVSVTSMKKKIPASMIRKAIEKGLGLLMMLAALSCTQVPIKPPAPAPLPEFPSTGAAATPIAPTGPPVEVTGHNPGKHLLAKPLTSTGGNSQARFSTDGARIIFVSRARPGHKQAQVYELHIGNSTEKRITFHDGDDDMPLYSQDGTRILFASTTDEIKEAPFAVERLMKNYDKTLFEKRRQGKAKVFRDMGAEGFEVYIQTPHGRVIERLTRSPGFDGDPDIDNKGKRIVFSTARDGDGVHLYLFTSGQPPKRITDGKFSDRGAQFSPDDKSLVWSRRLEEKPDSSQLLVASGNFRNPRVVVEGSSLNVHPAWHPSGGEIIFSSNRAGKTFDLFTVDLEGRCVRRVTDAEFDQFHPVFSPDGKQILFTGTRDGRQHVYLMEYVKPAECWPPPAPSPTPAPAPPTPAPIQPVPNQPSPTPGG